MIRMIANSVTLDAAAGDEKPRTISGIAVPYDVEATVLGGSRVRILQGALPTDGPARVSSRTTTPAASSAKSRPAKTHPTECCSRRRSPRPRPATIWSNC